MSIRTLYDPRANAMPAASASSPTRRARVEPRHPRRRARGPPPRPAPRRGRRRRARPATARASSCRSRPRSSRALVRARRWSSCATRPRAARIEAACAAEGIEPLGWRDVPVDPEALGDVARATAPRIEQLFLRPLGAGARRGRASRVPGPEARRAEARRLRRSLSFRTVTYKALCAADQLAAFYPDLRDPALAVPFAVFHQRFSTNTTPSWERAQPFRLLCHNGEINTIAGQRQLDAGPRGRLGAATTSSAPGHRRAAPTRRMLDNALELLVRGGRDIRHALAMLVPEAWEGEPELDADVRDFYRYHAGAHGAVGRARPALVFTDGRVVGAALDRNGLRPLRYAVCEDGARRLLLGGRRVDPAPEGAASGAASSAPGRCSPSTPTRAARGRTRRSSAGSRARRPYGAGSAGSRRSSTPASRVEPSARATSTPRQVAAGYTREEMTLVLRPIGRRRRTSRPPRWATTPRCRRSPAARARSTRTSGSASPRSPTRRSTTSASGCHVAPDAARGARPLLLGGARGRAPARAARVLPLPGRARAALAAPRARRDLRRATRGSSGAASGWPARPRRRSRGRRGDPAGHDGRAARAGADPVAARGRRGAPRPVGRACAPARRSWSRATSRARSHHFACLLGYGAEAICPRLALETRRRAGGGGQARRRHPSAGGGAAAASGTRSRRACSRSCRRWASPTSPLPRRPDLRRARPGPEVVDRCFAGHARAPSAASASPSSSARRLARHARPRRAGAAAREPRLRQVPQGRRAPRHEPGRRRRRCRRRRRRTRCARRASTAARLGRCTSASPRSSTAARRSSSATCWSSSPRRAGRPARRGRAGRGDRAPLLHRRDVARRALGRGARDARDRDQPPRRPLEHAARAARTRSASAPSATRGSSRSPRAASASRRSTSPSPRSCRSRSPRARSPARAASCPATRSPPRSPGCGTRSRAWR